MFERQLLVIQLMKNNPLFKVELDSSNIEWEAHDTLFEQITDVAIDPSDGTEHLMCGVTTLIDGVKFSKSEQFVTYADSKVGKEAVYWDSELQIFYWQSKTDNIWYFEDPSNDDAITKAGSYNKLLKKLERRQFWWLEADEDVSVTRNADDSKVYTYKGLHDPVEITALLEEEAKQEQIASQKPESKWKAVTLSAMTLLGYSMGFQGLVKSHISVAEPKQSDLASAETSIDAVQLPCVNDSVECKESVDTRSGHYPFNVLEYQPRAIVNTLQFFSTMATGVASVMHPRLGREHSMLGFSKLLTLLTTVQSSDGYRIVEADKKSFPFKPKEDFPDTETFTHVFDMPTLPSDLSLSIPKPVIYSNQAVQLSPQLTTVVDNSQATSYDQSGGSSDSAIAISFGTPTLLHIPVVHLPEQAELMQAKPKEKTISVLGKQPPSLSLSRQLPETNAQSRQSLPKPVIYSNQGIQIRSPESKTIIDNSVVTSSYTSEDSATATFLKSPSLLPISVAHFSEQPELMQEPSLPLSQQLSEANVESRQPFVPSAVFATGFNFLSDFIETADHAFSQLEQYIREVEEKVIPNDEKSAKEKTYTVQLLSNFGLALSKTGVLLRKLEKSSDDMIDTYLRHQMKILEDTLSGVRAYFTSQVPDSSLAGTSDLKNTSENFLNTASVATSDIDSNTLAIVLSVVGSVVVSIGAYMIWMKWREKGYMKMPEIGSRVNPLVPSNQANFVEDLIEKLEVSVEKLIAKQVAEKSEVLIKQIESFLQDDMVSMFVISQNSIRHARLLSIKEDLVKIQTEHNKLMGSLSEAAKRVILQDLRTAINQEKRVSWASALQLEKAQMMLNVEQIQKMFNQRDLGPEKKRLNGVIEEFHRLMKKGSAIISDGDVQKLFNQLDNVFDDLLGVEPELKSHRIVAAKSYEPHINTFIEWLNVQQTTGSISTEPARKSLVQLQTINQPLLEDLKQSGRFVTNQKSLSSALDRISTNLDVLDKNEQKLEMRLVELIQGGGLNDKKSIDDFIKDYFSLDSKKQIKRFILKMRALVGREIPFGVETQSEPCSTTLHMSRLLVPQRYFGFYWVPASSIASHNGIQYLSTFGAGPCVIVSLNALNEDGRLTVLTHLDGSHNSRAKLLSYFSDVFALIKEKAPNAKIETTILMSRAKHISPCVAFPAIEDSDNELEKNCTLQDEIYAVLEGFRASKSKIYAFSELQISAYHSLQENIDVSISVKTGNFLCYREHLTPESDRSFKDSLSIKETGELYYLKDRGNLCHVDNSFLLKIMDFYYYQPESGLSYSNTQEPGPKALCFGHDQEPLSATEKEQFKERLAGTRYENIFKFVI